MSAATYSKTAASLHWLIAGLLGFQIASGFSVDGAGVSAFAAYQIHKSIGMTVLVLSLLRLAVRFTHSRPAKRETGFTGTLAVAVQWGFYAVMILGPLTGWAMVSTAKVAVPTVLFGLVPLAHLPLPQSWGAVMDESHIIMAWVGIGLFTLHLAGALRHQLLLSDGLIGLMLPTSSRALKALALALLPLGAFLGAFLLSWSKAPAAPKTSGTQQQAALPTLQRASSSGAPTWTVLPGKSLRFLADDGFDGIPGVFKTWSADIAMDTDRPESADITIQVDLASADLEDGTMNAMVKGAEFFAVEAFPMATFVAQGATKNGNSYQADGTLDMKGVTRPQSIAFTLRCTDEKCGVEGSAIIKREAFKIGTGDAAASLEPTVALSFTFDAKRDTP